MKGGSWASDVLELRSPSEINHLPRPLVRGRLIPCHGCTHLDALPCRVKMQRLPMSQCPACHRPNPAASRFCGACGTPLVMRCPHCEAINARTRDACHHCRKALRPSAPEDTPLPVVPLLTPADEAPPPADWRLGLLDDPQSTLPMSMEPPASPLPTLVADLDAPVMPAPAPPPEPAPDLEARRANRRAAVRRSQLRRRTGRAASTVFDVLVLEPDLESRLQVCRVLVAFGFKPHVAVTVAEAQGLSLSRPHAAAILGLADDDDGAAALCRQLRDAPRGRPAALIAIVDRSHHADRVRMQLAGADQVLFRPAGRGDLARAFDACGLALPHDPRHGAPPA